MRLRRLDLTRFGNFTDFSLDFGVREQDKSDLHIIFGPNESGKTTAFEAYLDLLFGIPVRSQYDFLHDYCNMRVGACLEIDGAKHELVRIKKRQKDLLDGGGNPVNTAILARALGGMNRELYQAMFSLNDETIEKGGDDILASQGDLGQLLFSAAAGLSDLSGVLNKARALAEEFHKSRAHKTYLAEARRKLKTLDQDIRERDLNASKFGALRQALETAEKDEKAARTKRNGLLSKKASHEAVIECLPLLAERNGLHSDLEAVKDHTVFKEAWPEQGRELREREVAAITKESAAQDALKKLHEKQCKIKLDPDILAVRQKIEQLMDEPRSRALTAKGDLPKRGRELTDLNADIEQAMKNLGLTEVDPTHLAEPILGKLERMANGVETARAALGTARSELRRAKEEWDETSERGTDEGQALPLIDNLRSLIGRLEPEAVVSRLREAKDAVRREKRSATAAIANLAPWSGQIDHLPVAAITEEHARQIADERAEQKDDHKAAQKEFGKVTCELASIQARIDTMKTGRSLFTDDDADDARAQRDAVWTDHFATLSRETADRFHGELVRVDMMQDTRLGAAEQLAQLRELQLNAAEQTAQKKHWQKQVETHAQALEAKQGKFAALLKKLALPESFDPRDLQPWLKSLAGAHEASATLAQAKEDQTRAQTDITKAEAALRKAMNAAPKTGELSDLADMARQTLEEAGRIEERARAIEAARAKLLKREKKVEELKKCLSGAEAEWRKQAATPPLEYDTPSDFRDALPTLRKLGVWLSDREKLSRRIAAMYKDAADFGKALENISTRLGGSQNAEAFVLAKDLQAKLKSAEQAEHDLQTLKGQIQEQQGTLDSAANELDDVADAVVEMAQVFPDATGVKTAEDLMRAVSNAQKADDLRKRIKQFQQRIMVALGQPDFDTAAEILDGKEIPSVTALLQEVKADLSESEKTLDNAIGGSVLAKNELASVGGDDAVARLQEKRRTLLLEIAEEARKSLRLRLGILLAEKALARYRETHRSEMLAETEKAFTALTAGRYAKLETQPDGENELLLAVQSRDNRSISATKMSKGTRFQLYLALRIAGYGQFVSCGTTLPFVADDILETFDNTRTSAALDLLGKISLSGQALYFTHHEHVVDLARKKLRESCHIHYL